MNIDKSDLIRIVTSTLPELTLGQLHWLEKVVSIFRTDMVCHSDEEPPFTEGLVRNLGDAIRIHHCFSAEPFSKDKFEYVLVEVAQLSGMSASLAPKGIPGHDVTIDSERFSLKTQADKSVQEDKILISKYMELGKGKWGSDE